MTRDWQDRAACRHPAVQPADFSPIDHRGRVDHVRARDIARQACGPCPVRDHCLAHAAELVAAGHTPEEVVLAGMWWPANPYRRTHITPTDLLATEDAVV